jgi:hypothetical protein
VLTPILATDDPYQAAAVFVEAGWSLIFQTPRDSGDPLTCVGLAGARVEFAGFDAPTRFARVIRELAVAYGERSGNRVTIRWPVTQSELASLASVAEPTAQKALRRLREAGVISTGYRSLIIEDFHELNRTAGA